MLTRQSTRLKITNTAAFLTVLIVNSLANTLPINGQTTGEISDRLPVLFTPAGYVFSIWGVIYFLFFLWTAKQFLAKPTEEHIYAKAGYWFAISSFFNVSWLFLFHYERFNLTIFAMMGLWISLFILYSRITALEERSFLLRFPVSVYLGWVSVALVVNIGVFFVTNGINEFLFSGELWTAFVICGVIYASILFMRKMNDQTFPLVFVWALFGIFIGRVEEAPLVGWSAAAASFLLLIFVLARFRKKRTINSF
ncbi:TspO/MBR family protein [Alteribacillus sp. HJP-4]|uniref:TspO/MBR family protein n=1 Tax=Alteribacillus sp. HJP-4 TaxID=2775394 RepID=UPI0035CCE65F